MSAAASAVADPLAALHDLIGAARAAGADSADAIYSEGVSVGVSVRDGVADHVERAEGRDLGLRVFVGRRAAIVSSSTIDPADFRRLAERAVAMARVVPEDRFGEIGAATGAFDAAGLELEDGSTGEPDAASLTERARAAEAAALAVPGVSRTGEASAGYGRSRVALASSGGFGGIYARTSHSVSAGALAGEGTAMQRDHDGHAAIHLADLDDAAAIGRSAGERAVARLDPRRPATATVPVVWSPRVSGGLVGHLLGAINGAAIARGTSFLKDRMGTRIMREGITVRDDPRRVRGSRSRPFDGEGAATAPLDLIEDGVLRHWLLDGRSARQLGLASLGHAMRGTSGPPAPGATNVTLSPGDETPEALMSDIAEGLYVIEMMGSSINGLNGDYSRGAAGFMIRHGRLAEPVAEITVAGNLVAMLADLRPANDLVLRRGVDAPTVRIDGLTVAGA